MKDVLGISGHVKLEFTRKNGDVDVFEYENTVTDAFKEAVTDALADNAEDFAMNNLMASGDEGTQANGTKDGIILGDEDDNKFYETDCDTGTYGITENAKNIEVVAWTDRVGVYNAMALGKDMSTCADAGGDPSYSYKSIEHEIGAGDSLLITWTFNVG